MNPVLALIIANTIWGMASPLFKFALTNIPPFTLAGVRFIGASLIFLALTDWRQLKKIAVRDWWDIIVGGALLGIFMNIVFFFLGLKKSESINAPVIGSSGPIFLFVFSVLFLHERPKMRVLAGMIVALFGVLVIVFSPFILDGGRLADLQMFEGNLFFVIATFASVASTLILKRVLKKIDSLVVTEISFIISGLMFLPLMIHEWQSWSFSQLNLAGITGIVFGVVFSSALGYYLYNYGLAKIAAQEVGLFTYIDPVVAVAIAAPLLGEYPNLFFILGAGLVLAGIFVAEKRLHYHPFRRLK